jgi:hypothetical protein
LGLDNAIISDNGVFPLFEIMGFPQNVRPDNPR